jgi:hypothetical protein
MNPAEAHYSHKDKRRLKRNGYWKGVEVGWPIADPGGAGRLGPVRGTLDGTPTDDAFPYPKGELDTSNVEHSPNHWYTTEGWGISNRAWQSTVIFSTVGSHELSVLDKDTQKQCTQVQKGDSIIVRLRAALNMDPQKAETGSVNVFAGDNFIKTLTVTETGPNTGIFEAVETIDYEGAASVSFSYGYLGLGKKATVTIAD